MGKPQVKLQLGGPRRRWYQNHLQNLGREGGMNWNDLVQDRDRWRTLVKAVLNTSGFHKMRGIS